MTTVTTPPRRALPIAQRSWWAAKVAGVGALLGLVAQYLMVEADSCEGWGCLGAGLLALAVGTVLVPVLGWVGLRLVGCPGRP